MEILPLNREDLHCSGEERCTFLIAKNRTSVFAKNCTFLIAKNCTLLFPVYNNSLRILESGRRDRNTGMWGRFCAERGRYRGAYSSLLQEDGQILKIEQ